MEKELNYQVEDLNLVPEFYRGYIQKAPSTDILAMLKSGEEDMLKLFELLNESDGNYAYSEGKWTFKELILHIIDAERIMAYRALRFSRNDQTVLPGFDQDIFVDATQNALKTRSLKSLKREYTAVRNASITLFESFTQSDLHKLGNANGFEISVGILGYIIYGHEQHHLQIVKERYLTQLNKD